MTSLQNISFGPDKSQILRGLAIIFMIALHNNTTGLFKICVPIFTFLVGYGYAFAKKQDIMHGLKRIWNLLSHFWLILLGIFLPVAITYGDYHPTIGNILFNMFGLESNLNWYSWYIYFYIYAMIVMIPLSRVIKRFKIPAILALVCCCFGLVFVIHQIPNWSDNIWIQAIHDCFLCSPVMFAGFYLAEGGGHYKNQGTKRWAWSGCMFSCYGNDIFCQSNPIFFFHRLDNSSGLLYSDSGAFQYRYLDAATKDYDSTRYGVDEHVVYSRSIRHNGDSLALRTYD